MHRRPRTGTRLALVAALAGATLLTAQGPEPLHLDTATIAELTAAMDSGRLTSERLTAAYLERITAYDRQGPAINAIITLNPGALTAARAADVERRARGPRGPLHGIPVVLKDNIDTSDLPTTAGCQILKGSLPPDDAFLVRKLRDAGAIILAKVNLSELASDGGAPSGFSSMGGQTRNPHDPSRAPAGSSGGTGAAIAAAFAQFGLGTDTAASVRAPCSANGIAGLRPTFGLLSRDGIVPLALTFDTAGPMARHVHDLAVALTVLAGPDPADAATLVRADSARTDYTKFLRRGSLRGARIGVARDFMGRDAGTDRVMEQALERLRDLGATIVDPVSLPSYALAARSGVYNTVRRIEFPWQLQEYLLTLPAGYPRTLAELVARAEDPTTGYSNPRKLESLRKAVDVPGLEDPIYLAAKHEGRALLQAAMEGVFARDQLDALVYPTLPRPAEPIDRDPRPPGSGDESALTLAPLLGYPDLVVPAGLTDEGLPVTISFLGPPFSEGRLLGYGFDFEQAARARVLPRHTPRLSGAGLAP